MARYGVGASLASMGQGQKQDAMEVLGRAADVETNRNAQNEMLRAQEKAQRQQLGGTVGSLAGAAIGAQYGSVGGPWGSLIGGLVGAVAAGAFK